ncbi:hypothetical protein NEOCIP111885_01451 [Pseudoneobacillus rhizosphaerae]|uniref:Uncharacterized protein n=1 Tax=Pseudoneobacillus rhizosphaerae TaxID=2880968 RepID=A0A9C7G884_9BACI|nr:hypothetical protein NEOCIP111885_01451 [Pseudoneobacillus rhizosphaerae]
MDILMGGQKAGPLQKLKDTVIPMDGRILMTLLWL